MEFDASDKLTEIAFTLNLLVTEIDELIAEPAAGLDTDTLASLRRSLEEPPRLLALLEEQRESGSEG